MQVSPLAGKPARRVDPHQRAPAGDRLLHGASGSLRARAARRASGLPDIGDPRSTTPSMRRTFSRSPRRSASTVSSRASTDRCSSAAIRTRCRIRRLRARWKCWPANGVEVMVDAGNGVHADAGHLACRCSPTIAGARRGLADGIVITPSHNPPGTAASSTIRPTGGPADTRRDSVGSSNRPTRFIADGLRGVARVPFERARPRPPRIRTTSYSRT